MLHGDNRPLYSFPYFREEKSCNPRRSPGASLLNDSIATHLEAFRDRKIEEEITFLFPNPVFRVAGHVLWIAEIATTEGKAIRSAKGFDEVGIELFDAFYGPVSLVGVLLGRSSAIAATV